MRAAATAATALTLVAFTAPAPALDPAQRDPAFFDRATAGIEPGPQAPANSQPHKSTSAKAQDRIAPGDPIRYAFLPEFRLAPRAEAIPQAQAAPPDYPWDAALDAHIARHAAMNGVPLELARRVVKRESGGNPRASSKGNYGLMQIRLGTAKAMGYRGNARGLLDAETNMTYAMRYLSGALRAANGNHDRAVALYARGYYPEAKKLGFSPYDPPRAAGLAPLTATR